MLVVQNRAHLEVAGRLSPPFSSDNQIREQKHRLGGVEWEKIKPRYKGANKSPTWVGTVVYTSNPSDLGD